jgi:hypothetical protein
MIFITINALHVPGGSSAHHQELKTVYTTSGICRAFSAYYRYSERVFSITLFSWKAMLSGSQLPAFFIYFSWKFLKITQQLTVKFIPHIKRFDNHKTKFFFFFILR